MSIFTRPLLLILVAYICLAQSGSDLGWFADFLRWQGNQPEAAEIARSRTLPSTVIDRYEKKLLQDGLSAGEAERRHSLLQNRFEQLMADLWNHRYLQEPTTVDDQPLQMLVEVIKGRKPGTALDVGMGSGRNAVWLAAHGWTVTGFDVADKAVALAVEKARSIGAHLEGVVASTHTFDYGTERWDLVLFSYMTPDRPADVVRSLRPGGVVVVEGGADWFNGDNDLRTTFPTLQVLRHEVVEGRTFNRKTARTLRFCAQKPLATK